MELQLKHGSTEDLELDLLTLGVRPDGITCRPLERLDKLTDGAVRRELERRGFDGRANSQVMLPSYGANPARNVLLYGLGAKPDHDVFRLLAAATVAGARTIRGRSAAILLDEGVDANSKLQALAEGAALAAYRFGRFKSSNDEIALNELTIANGDDDSAAERAIEAGRRMAVATNFARDLINLPADEATPEFLARTAFDIARRDTLECEVYDRAGIEELKMGALLGVAKASPREPRFIVMRYRPVGASDGHVALVGKGITFDSGGLNLKPAASMEEQKRDMTGAAIMLAVMSELRWFNPAVEVRAYLPCTENMVGPAAIKPGDVLRSRLGKTIEVMNTDAEGRLILADALAYACEAKPRAVIDAGTLTAAVRAALGTRVAAIMGNDPLLIDRIRQAARAAGEPLWELPLVAEYADELRSSVADLRNIGTSGNAGTIMCGLFLKEFVNCSSWVHLDLAGVSFAKQGSALAPAGAVGFGVRTILRYLLAEH
ncbi:MAG TPA: leucyl aminopeptidase [Candidatus Binataceae bacterium]|nr:leucyl aminopeptidase [Candidatus Binataceae bacterium]